MNSVVPSQLCVHYHHPHHLFLTWLQNFRITLRSWGFPQYGNTWRKKSAKLKREDIARQLCQETVKKSTSPRLHSTSSKTLMFTLSNVIKNRAAVMFPEEALRHSIMYESLFQLLSCWCQMWCEKIYTSLHHSTYTGIPLFLVSLVLSVQEAYLQMV